MNNGSKIKILLALAVVVLFFGCLNSSSTTPSSTPTSHKQTTSNQPTTKTGSQVKQQRNQTTKKNVSSSVSARTKMNKTQNQHMNKYNVTSASAVENRTRPQQNHGQMNQASNNQTMDHQAVAQQNHETVRTQNRTRLKNMTLTTVKAFEDVNGPVECMFVNKSANVIQYFWLSKDEMYTRITKLYPGTFYNATVISLIDFNANRIYVNLTQLLDQYRNRNATLVDCMESKCRWVYIENKTGVEKVLNEKLFPANATLSSSQLTQLTPKLSCKKISQMPVLPSQLRLVCNKEQYEIAVKECAPSSTTSTT